MSYLAQEWAEEVPVASVYERVILMALARRADADGTDAFPSKRKMARMAGCDQKTVQRHLRSLRDRHVIAPGNQAAANYIEERYRPTVYDLLIPFGWYSQQQVEKIDKERAEKGKPALLPEARPPLAAPPDKPRRADKGKPRAKRPAADSEPEPAENPRSEQGGLEDPPDEPAPNPPDLGGQGGLSVPARGDSQSPLRGDLKTPEYVLEINRSFNSVGGLPPAPPPASADANAPGKRWSSRRGPTSKPSFGGNQPLARARERAGDLACTAIDANLDLPRGDLERLIAEGHNGQLTDGQIAGRAATLHAETAAAARRPAAGQAMRDQVNA